MRKEFTLMKFRNVLAALAAAPLFASPALAAEPKVVDETGQYVEFTPHDDTAYPTAEPRRGDSSSHHQYMAFDDTSYGGSGAPEQRGARDAASDGARKEMILACCDR
jgi:hypothetical protein